MTRALLGEPAAQLSPRELIPLQASVVEATRTASRLYPTNPTSHARLAEASAEISMFQDAAEEADEALRLDVLLAAHPDKRLPDAVRRAAQGEARRMGRESRSKADSPATRRNRVRSSIDHEPRIPGLPRWTGLVLSRYCS